MASHAHLPLADLSIRRVRSAGDIHPSSPSSLSPPPHTFPPTPPPIRVPSPPHIRHLTPSPPPSAIPHPITRLQSPILPSPTTNGSNRDAPRTFIRRCFAFLGYGPGNRARKELVSLIWNIFFCIVQVVVTVSLIAYSNTHKSPTMAPLTEWQACDRPLGLWNSLWLVRLSLGCLVNIWGWNIDRHAATNNNSRSRDTENGTNPSPSSLGAHGHFDTPRSQSATTNRNPQSRNSRSENARNTPQGRVYSRVSLLLSLLSMSWFLTAHILVYTSLTTCRFAAPHLWWLTFSILCILYLMILEILFIAVVLFILGPLAFLLWNIFLICIGRHPMQNPHYINPEIGKLPRSIVDKIPLVLYIPTPPEGFEEGLARDGSGISKPLPVYNSSNPHLGPNELAKSSTTSNGNGNSNRPRRFFVFLRRKPRSGRDASAKSKSGSGASSSSKNKSGGEKGSGKDGEDGSGGVRTWEDHWEPGEYPFVRLEENRAACAICLLDFEEPKKVGEIAAEKEKEKEKETDVKDDVDGHGQTVNDPSSSSSPQSPPSPINDPSSSTSQPQSPTSPLCPSITITSPHNEIEEIPISPPTDPLTSSSTSAPSPSSPSSSSHPDGIPHPLYQADHPSSSPSSSNIAVLESPMFADNDNDHEIFLDEDETGMNRRRRGIGHGDGDDDDDDDEPILEAIGEGAQPLRLLGCGHAFHKTCIDPWLTGISGRCPTCQRPVVTMRKKGESHR